MTFHNFFRHFEQTGKMPMGAASVEAGAGRCHLEHTCGRAKSFQDPSQAFHSKDLMLKLFTVGTTPKLDVIFLYLPNCIATVCGINIS